MKVKGVWNSGIMEEPMMSSVEGLMIGIRLLRRGALHSPSMKSCLLGIEIAIFFLLFSVSVSVGHPLLYGSDLELDQ